MQRFLPATYRTLLLVSVLAVTTFLVFQLFKSLKNIENSNELVEHTYQVLLASDQLSSSWKDIEISQYRYLIDGLPQRLALYSRAMAELPKPQAELHRLVADNPRQQARLKEVDQLLASRLAMIAHRMEVRRTQGKAAAEVLFNTDGGIALGRQLRSLLNDVNSDEQVLLNQRRSDAARQSAQTYRLSIGGAVILLVLLSCINYVLERDVIIRRRAEREVRSNEIMFRGMFDNAAVGIALLSSAGEFQLVNSRFCDITGYSRDELLTRTFQSVIPPETNEGSPPGRLSEIPAAAKISCHRGNGSHTWVNMTLSLLPQTNGDPDRFIGIVQDINAQVQAEASLYAANLSLVRSNEALQQFAYASSHDLQEPLRTISMFSQLLARDYNVKFDERGQSFLTAIIDGARRMSQLIDALLAYSHASSTDRQSLKYFNLEDTLTETLESLRARIEEERAVITSEKLPVVYADPVRFYQVLQNLIGNALKYRRPDVPPEIRISCRREQTEWVFAVCDNGLGFPPESAERIFGIFKRLHGREIAGTGVGLAVAKAVVERRGGRIWAESPGPDQGASFCFTIPIAAQ